MILVMAGHGAAPFRLALSFVPVPIFFFLSGYLYYEGKYSSFGRLLRARARSLLVPYFIFGIVNSAVWLALHRSVLSQGWGAAVLPLLRQIAGIDRAGEDPYLGPYWFILCLFLTEIIYFGIAKAGNLLSSHVAQGSMRWRILLTAIVTCIGFAWVRKGSHWLPWSLDVAMVAISFYTAGHAAQRYAGFKELFHKRWLVAVCLGGLILGVINTETSVFHRATIYSGYYHNPILFMGGAFSALYLFLLVMFRIPDFKPVLVIGRESLAFLVLHSPIFFPLAGLLDRVLTATRLAGLFPGSPALHWIAVRAVKGTSGLLVTAGGIVVAYLIIAPFALTLRRYAAFLLDGREHCATSGEEMVLQRSPAPGGARP